MGAPLLPTRLMCCCRVQWAVRQTAEAENHMTSVERVLAYTQLPQERPATVAAGGGAPPKGWPSSAKLEFDRVEVCCCSGDALQQDVWIS